MNVNFEGFDTEAADTSPTFRMSILLEDIYQGSPVSLERTYTEDNHTWPSILNDFIKAMEIQFGYPILQKVFIQDSGFNWGMRDWGGGTIKLDSKEG